MEKDEWLRAIKCTKEELIEWLNEMYEEDKRLRKVIEKYEESYNVVIEKGEKIVEKEPFIKAKISYTKVKAKNFEYIKDWKEYQV